MTDDEIEQFERVVRLFNNSYSCVRLLVQAKLIHYKSNDDCYYWYTGQSNDDCYYWYTGQIYGLYNEPDASLLLNLIIYKRNNQYQLDCLGVSYDNLRILVLHRGIILHVLRGLIFNQDVADAIRVLSDTLAESGFTDQILLQILSNGEIGVLHCPSAIALCVMFAVAIFNSPTIAEGETAVVNSEGLVYVADAEGVPV